MRPFAGGFAACIACGSLFASRGLAHAQASPPGDPPQVLTPPRDAPQVLADAIELDPGATCLEENRLVAEVQTWLGRDRLRSDVHVRVRGDDHDPRAVAFRITRGASTRERRFDGLPAGCDDATAVVGLAIALAIDANALTGFVAPVSAESSEPRGLIALQASAGFDVLPSGSLGAAAGVEYRAVDWLSVRLDLLTQFSWANTIDTVKGQYDVALAAASPQICAGGDIAIRTRFELCSGPAAGVLHAAGHGYAVSRSSTGSWVVASGGLRLRFVAGIPWVLDVQGVFPIHVPAFRAESAAGTPAFREPNPAGALLSVGPAFTF